MSPTRTHTYPSLINLANPNLKPVCRSRAVFNNASLEDLGTFSCVATHTEGMSSSYTLTEEGESKLKLGNCKAREDVCSAVRQDVHFCFCCRRSQPSPGHQP